MRSFILAIISLLLFGCGERTSNIVADTLTREAYLQTLDSAEIDKSLIFWTSDTAFTTDRELMLLLDTLYQHVKKDDFPSEVRTEEKWMSDYRSRLSAYYDAHHLGNDTISIFAKADSVLDRGVWLLELDDHLSTMEMIVSGDVEFTFDRCREYSLLTQVIACCEDEDAKSLVYKEWSLYEQMLKVFAPIASHIAVLDSWGGSIAGVMSVSAYLEISQARRDMYQTILDIMKSGRGNGTGVYPDYAERLLFDCCNTSLKKIVDDTIELYKEYSDKEFENGFFETVDDTKAKIQQLRPIVKEWISLMDNVDSALTFDGFRHLVQRAASYMLIKWASIVTEE